MTTKDEKTSPPIICEVARLKGAYAQKVMAIEDVREAIELVKLTYDGEGQNVPAPVWHKTADVYWTGKYVIVFDNRNTEVILYRATVDQAIAAFEQWRNHYAGVMPKVQAVGEHE